MRGRHALFLGVGLGGLATLTFVLLSTGALLSRHTAARLAAYPTPSPPTTASPSPDSSPAAAAIVPAPGGAVAYDPENHGIIQFGGVVVTPQPDGTNPTHDVGNTWLWDGKQWRDLNVDGPPARSVAMMAYDSVRHQLVLFGGSGPTGAGDAKLLQDTWTWDGTQWQEQHPAHVPNPRARAAIAFDERRGVVVMFGGEGEGTTTYNATWTWDGTDWTLQNPTTAPPGRHFATMAYDAARGVIVLFGGSYAGARFNDTWTWDGSDWTLQPGPAPAARGWSTLAYDAGTQQVVAYVYFALDNNPVTEYTITWDGKQWTDRTSTGDPSPRAETRMTYDPDTGQAVLFGPQSDIWTWDGANWSLWQPSGTP